MALGVKHLCTAAALTAVMYASVLSPPPATDRKKYSGRCTEQQQEDQTTGTAYKASGTPKLGKGTVAAASTEAEIAASCTPNQSQQGFHIGTHGR